MPSQIFYFFVMLLVFPVIRAFPFTPDTNVQCNLAAYSGIAYL